MGLGLGLGLGVGLGLRRTALLERRMSSSLTSTAMPALLTHTEGGSPSSASASLPPSSVSLPAAEGPRAGEGRSGQG
eukprot:COSAG04_NODE_100_length_26314_cov_36.469044_10_plen_77_part_00